MKRKTKTKWTLFMAGTLLAAALTGCGGQGTQDTGGSSTEDKTSIVSQESSNQEQPSDAEGENGTDITYPIQDAGTLTWGQVRQSQWSERYDSFADLPLGQELQERTGYTLEMEHVDNAQAMNLLLVSGQGNLPDVITFNLNSYYAGKEPKAVSDGIIYGMTPEFLQENAPDYWAYLDANPNIRKSVTTNDGLVSCFALIRGDEILKSSNCLFIRDDWCEQLGVSIPETADEMYEVLKRFKEELNAEIPMEVTAAALRTSMNYGQITSPFGLPTRDIYVENGTVKAGYAQEEYKDVLAWLNKLYTEKLLDPNISTVDQNTVNSNILTGVSGFSCGLVGTLYRERNIFFSIMHGTRKNLHWRTA